MSTFKGQKVHTATWPDDYDSGKWKGENDVVVVIGAGSFSVQIAPGLQKHIKNLHLFVRSRT